MEVFKKWHPNAKEFLKLNKPRADSFQKLNGKAFKIKGYSNSFYGIWGQVSNEGTLNGLVRFYDTSTIIQGYVNKGVITKYRISWGYNEMIYIRNFNENGE